jgi:hypothetical protein
MFAIIESMFVTNSKGNLFVWWCWAIHFGIYELEIVTLLNSLQDGQPILSKFPATDPPPLSKRCKPLTVS